VRRNAKIAKIPIAVAVAFLACSSARADGILYALPETSGSGVNLAAISQSGQTNTAYNACEQPIGLCTNGVQLLGGDVTNLTNLTWNVNTLIVWAVDSENMSSPTVTNPATATPTMPADFSSGLTLVGGNVDGPIGSLSSNYAIAAAPYSGSSNGTNYYSPTSGEYDGVWQLTFNVADLTIAPGETFVFALNDPNHEYALALNATLCNNTNSLFANYNDYPSMQPCAGDGIVLVAGGYVTGAYNYGDTGPTYDDGLISSDVDIELDGVATPEPATWALCGVGIGVLGWVRRRRR
jgi:hypothetical protein